MNANRWLAVAGALAGVAAMAACGGSDAETSPSAALVTATNESAIGTAATTPATASATSVEATEPAGPRRIIPLDGDLAEIVFALGLGDEVVATDLSATYPPEADALPQIGYQRALNAEPILAFDPTVLLATPTAGPPEALDDLERAGLPVHLIDVPATPDAPAAKIRAVADLLDADEAGERLATEVEAEIDAATPGPEDALTGLRVAMLYVRGEGVQLLFGDGTGIDWLIKATGATNVADELGITDSAEVTAEALLAAAPDVLLVTEDGMASVGGLDGLLALPNVAGTPAARQRAVLAYDAQLMLGNGPRTGQFLAELATDLGDLRATLTP